jgi:PPM family protein phosphatase
MDSSVLPITLCVILLVVVGFFVFSGRAPGGGSRPDGRPPRGRRQRRVGYVRPAVGRLNDWRAGVRDRRADGAGTATAPLDPTPTGTTRTARPPRRGGGQRRRQPRWRLPTRDDLARVRPTGTDRPTRPRTARDTSADRPRPEPVDAAAGGTEAIRHLSTDATVPDGDDLSRTSVWAPGTDPIPSTEQPAAPGPAREVGDGPGGATTHDPGSANETDTEAAMADSGAWGGPGEPADPEATAWRPGPGTAAPPPPAAYPGSYPPLTPPASPPPPPTTPPPGEDDATTDRVPILEEPPDDIVAVEPSVPTTAPLRLAAAGRTKRGKRGGPNEDAFVVVDGLLAVADGVGGEAAGQIASTLAVTTVAGYRPQYATDPREGLRRAVERANKVVISRPDEQPMWRGMACTLDVVVLGRHQETGETLFVAHVGDSSVWLQPRRQHPRLLTTPHAIKNGPLLNAIGLAPDVQADLLAEKVAVGDRVVMASDGITKVMTPQALDGLLMELSSESPEHAADRLVEAAIVAGARDDTTIVVADVVKA